MGEASSELPVSIIKRIPIRLNFDDNYYIDRFQGIPIGGYTKIFERMLDGIPLELKTDFLSNRDYFIKKFDHIIFTGPIDSFFDYEFGHLEYRSLRFEHQILRNCKDFQGNTVINFTDKNIPYTRIYEHKHFDLIYSSDKTAITQEFPERWNQVKSKFIRLIQTKTTYFLINIKIFKKISIILHLEEDWVHINTMICTK